MTLNMGRVMVRRRSFFASQHKKMRKELVFCPIKCLKVSNMSYMPSSFKGNLKKKSMNLVLVNQTEIDICGKDLEGSTYEIEKRPSQKDKQSDMKTPGHYKQIQLIKKA